MDIVIFLGIFILAVYAGTKLSRDLVKPLTPDIPGTPEDDRD
jgi:hypothetical protein